MKKRITIKRIGEKKQFNASSYDNETTVIDEVLKWLVESKKKGATHIEWYARCDSGGSSEEVEARAYYYHIETDEEFEVRESQEREDQEKMYALKLKKEKELYEKLRQKFGN